MCSVYSVVEKKEPQKTQKDTEREWFVCETFRDFSVFCGKKMNHEIHERTRKRDEDEKNSIYNLQCFSVCSVVKKNEPQNAQKFTERKGFGKSFCGYFPEAIV